MAYDSLSPVKIQKGFLLFSTYRTSTAGKPAIYLNMVEVHASKIMVRTCLPGYAASQS